MDYTSYFCEYNNYSNLLSLQVRLKGHMNFCPPYKIEAVREYMLVWGRAYQCQKLQNLGITLQIPEKFESCDYQVVPWYHFEDYQTIGS